jgi:hypothetical protein
MHLMPLESAGCGQWGKLARKGEGYGKKSHSELDERVLRLDSGFLPKRRLDDQNWSQQCLFNTKVMISFHAPFVCK